MIRVQGHLCHVLIVHCTLCVQGHLCHVFIVYTLCWTQRSLCTLSVQGHLRQVFHYVHCLLDVKVIVYTECTGPPVPRVLLCKLFAGHRDNCVHSVYRAPCATCFIMHTVCWTQRSLCTLCTEPPVPRVSSPSLPALWLWWHPSCRRTSTIPPALPASTVR